MNMVSVIANNFLVLFLFIASILYGVESTCKTKVKVECDSITDLVTFGKAKWTELVVGNPKTRTTKEPDLILSKVYLRSVSSLEELTINTILTDVDPDTFEDMNSLFYLKLFNNKLTVIKRRAFSGKPK